MLQPLYNEEAVRVGDHTYRLVINFRTIDATETQLGGRSYESALTELLTGRPSTGLQARVVWGLLREHHPEVTIEEADALARGPSAADIGEAIGKLLHAAFPIVQTPKAKGENPPKRRGQSKPSMKRGAQKA